MIPGQLIAFLTFPGVIVHEIAHQFFCRIFKVSVIDICYYRYENPSGYVIHELPSKVWQHVIIGIGPFIINSVIGAVISFPSAIQVIKFESGTIVDYFLVWLGVSIAMHSFPSRGDANSMWETINSNETPLLLRIFTVPIITLIYLGAYGSIIWLDLAYGYFVASLLPNLVISLLS